MKLEKLIQKNLTLGEAQFLIGIVLHQLGQPDAGEAVIGYLGTYTKGDKETDETVALKEERERLKQELTQKYPSKFLYGVLNYFWVTPVIKRRKSSSRANVSTSMVTLGVMLEDSNVTPDVIYKRCQSIMLEYTTSEYIVLYMDSKPARDYIKKAVRSEFTFSSDMTYNILDNATLEEIVDNFKDRVAVCYANAYRPDTGTPLAFLRHSFNNYYVLSCKKYETNFDLLRILNRKGFEVAETEDGDSVLDLLNIEDDRDVVSLDFSKTVYDIYMASYLLFGLQQETDTYFDIYSYHRQKVLKDRQKIVFEDLAKICKSWRITCSDEVSNDVGSSSIKSQYHRNRQAICNYMETLLIRSLLKEQINDFLQGFITIDQAFSAGAQAAQNIASPKSNCILKYNTPGDDKQSIYTNSQKLEIIMNGYLALKNLLEFIDSKSNCYGITLYNFRTDIFRQPLLQRRFDNLSDYVLYVDLVLGFVNIVKKDSDRSKDYLFGIRSNDAVWNYIASDKGSSVLNKLRSVSLGQCKIVTNIEHKKNMARNNIMVYEYLKSVFGSESRIPLLSVADVLSYPTAKLLQLSDVCCNYALSLNNGGCCVVYSDGTRDELQEAINNYKMCCTTASCFLAMLKLFKLDLYDEEKDMFYGTDCENILPEIYPALQAAKQLAEEKPNIVTSSGRNFYKLILNLYFSVVIMNKYLKGEELNLDPSQMAMSGMEFHTFLCFTGLMTTYFSRLIQVSRSIQGMDNAKEIKAGKKDNNFMNTALFAANKFLLTNDTKALSVYSLASLYLSDTKQYLKPELNIEEDEIRNKFILEMYRRWLKRSSGLQAKFRVIDSMMDSLLHDSNGTNAETAEEESMLKNADLSLSATPDNVYRINKARLILKSVFKFSTTNHFALTSNGYFKYCNSYVHEDGYLVSKASNNSATPFIVMVMDDALLDKVRGMSI